jgi:formylglycine-generating enzyme required for sulfatase activity
MEKDVLEFHIHLTATALPEPKETEEPTKTRCEVRPDFTAQVEERGDETAAVRLTGGVELPLRKIPAGTFTMGSEKADDEKPPHEVRITRPFYLGVAPVTQAQWDAVMTWNPSRFDGDERPVEKVNWHEAREFCRALSQETDRQFDLPTEAQWEYACRADPKDRHLEYCFGDDPEELDRYAHYGKWGEGTIPVAQKDPNEWGLYDMHGNVWEWCHDYYDGGYYQKSPEEDPCNLEEGASRVLRGGSCDFDPEFCRSAYRTYYHPVDRPRVGFRVLLLVRE